MVKRLPNANKLHERELVMPFERIRRVTRKSQMRHLIMSCKIKEYADELQTTAKNLATAGKGILAVDESTNTCGKRLADIGLENTEENRQAYRGMLFTAEDLGRYISGAILFEETLVSKSCRW